MTYEHIRDWVSENFDLNAYFSPDELARAVQTRFQEDGSYFPPEARQNIRELWIDNIRGFNDDSLDYQGPRRETLDDIRNDYRNRFSNFFENTLPEEVYHDVEETLATPPPVIEQLPNPEEQQRESSNWYAGGFRNVAKRIWSFFNR